MVEVKLPFFRRRSVVLNQGLSEAAAAAVGAERTLCRVEVPDGKGNAQVADEGTEGQNRQKMAPEGFAAAEHGYDPVGGKPGDPGKHGMEPEHDHAQGKDRKADQSCPAVARMPQPDSAEMGAPAMRAEPAFILPVQEHMIKTHLISSFLCLMAVGCGL